ncbi:MAG TPA: rRNA maturation RNase YbeY [Vicinamibacterales bacterium]|nr:rRNA maturation RNase YbeY [Vicinamibacterales bacterium]
MLPAGVRAPGLASWLTSVAPARARGAVTIAIVSDQRIRQLNRTYRHKDKVTDVLSFPAHGPAKAGHYDSRDAGPGIPRAKRDDIPDVVPGFSRAFLGDVVIAAGAARRQAREAGHSLQSELKVLALHGLLHLLGYDHEHDDGRMARLEQRLRRKGGLREGLIERGTYGTHGTR